MRGKTRILFAVLIGAVFGGGSALPMWRAFDNPLDWLIPFAIPGIIVSIPFSAMGIGNIHDPSLVVVAVADFFFYAWVSNWLMARRWRRER